MIIDLTPENLKKLAAILVITLALAGGAYYLFASGVFANASLPDDPELAQAGGVVAASGAETFFALDYEEGSEQWLSRVCAISTEDGCNVTEAFYFESISQILEEKKPKTTCSAEFVEKVDAGIETEGVGPDEMVIYEWEVWIVNVTLSDPWDGAEKEQEVYVQVNTEEGEWKFARILFDQEAKKYSEEDIQ